MGAWWSGSAYSWHDRRVRCVILSRHCSAHRIKQPSFSSLEHDDRQVDPGERPRPLQMVSAIESERRCPHILHVRPAKAQAVGARCEHAISSVTEVVHPHQASGMVTCRSVRSPVAIPPSSCQPCKGKRSSQPESVSSTTATNGRLLAHPPSSITRPVLCTRSVSAFTPASSRRSSPGCPAIPRSISTGVFCGAARTSLPAEAGDALGSRLPVPPIPFDRRRPLRRSYGQPAPWQRSPIMRP